MCGIVGYLGEREAVPVLLDGLKRLEYRGYDSSGVAVLNGHGIKIERAEGKINALENKLVSNVLQGCIGIGHTRWATHGVPSVRNAHPHRVAEIVVVHNGIIENYSELRKKLTQEGCKFKSETDTEVFCHLIHQEFQKTKDTLVALRNSLEKVRGSYGLVVLNEKDPEHLYLARLGSPLVVGFGDKENFVASDIPAILPYTRRMTYLEDGEVGMLSRRELIVLDAAGLRVDKKIEEITWDAVQAEKGGYKHFMLKEIFEQPHVVEDALAGRLDVEQGTVLLEELVPLLKKNHLSFENISIVACGTSWHAGLIARYWLEGLARISTKIDLASEFRYRNPLVNDKTLIIGISQSGETADTLAAMRLAKEKGAKVLAICNVVGSSMAREADAVLYTHAGPEIGVASTKAFVAQLTALFLTALFCAQKLDRVDGETSTLFTEELRKLPKLIKALLQQHQKIRNIVEQLAPQPHFLFIARGPHYPIALEGALKLKEISYVYAEGFAAGELKHGPIALIDKGVPVFALAPQNETYEKILSNIAEVKARGAWVVGLGDNGDAQLSAQVVNYISVPKIHPLLSPILYAVPLQLFAYYLADFKGTDVDQPRNLAKSVTVE